MYAALEEKQRIVKEGDMFISDAAGVISLTAPTPPLWQTRRTYCSPSMRRLASVDPSSGSTSRASSDT
jgi:hypothetical protein